MKRYIHVKSTAGELFYLRLLLIHVPGSAATSWDSLRRPPPSGGDATFQGYARELGLLQDDAETMEMLTEGVRTLSSTVKVCELFAETLVWLDAHDKAAMWYSFLKLMDQHHAAVSPIALYLSVDEILIRYNTSLAQMNVPAPDPAAVLAPTDCAEREYTSELRNP